MKKMIFSLIISFLLLNLYCQNHPGGDINIQNIPSAVIKQNIQAFQKQINQINPVNTQSIIENKQIIAIDAEPQILAEPINSKTPNYQNNNALKTDLSFTNQQNHQQVLQIQTQSKLQQALDQKLPKWIRDELQQVQSILQLPITETFTFIVSNEQETTFKWNPSKEKQLKLILNIFFINSQGNLQVIQQAQENEYVEVMIRNPNKQIFNSIGTVYRTKILTVDFDTDYKYLKFVNKHSYSVAVQIDIQKLEYVVLTGVSDPKLSTSNSKMNSILSQSESTQIKRQHLYKWQWGYYQNEKQHQLRILGLTGIELVVILLTAITQMYYLKGLLDNRALV